VKYGPHFDWVFVHRLVCKTSLASLDVKGGDDFGKKEKASFVASFFFIKLLFSQQFLLIPNKKYFCVS